MTTANCPNCGAPITGSSCPYCNTRFENVASMAVGKPVKVSFENDGWAYEFKMIVSNMNIDMNADTCDFYSDERRMFSTLIGADYYARFSGRVVNQDGTLFKVRRVDD